jgi:hypothetical protein
MSTQSFRRYDIKFSKNTRKEITGSVFSGKKEIMTFWCSKSDNKKRFLFHDARFGQKTYVLLVDRLVSYADLKFGRNFIWA